MYEVNYQLVYPVSLADLYVTFTPGFNISFP